MLVRDHTADGSTHLRPAAPAAQLWGHEMPPIPSDVWAWATAASSYPLSRAAIEAMKHRTWHRNVEAITTLAILRRDLDVAAALREARPARESRDYRNSQATLTTTSTTSEAFRTACSPDRHVEEAVPPAPRTPSAGLTSGAGLTCD
jgi:hypothetical protein